MKWAVAAATVAALLSLPALGDDKHQKMTAGEIRKVDKEARKITIKHGRLENLGNVPQVEVGFQYRLKKGGTDLSEKTEPWTDAAVSPRSARGEYSFELRNLDPNREYEFRAAVHHPLITTYGREKTFRTAR